MDRQSYRVAIIDLGSNTARLIVMQTIPGYAYRLVDEIREVVRLRKGMTKKGLHKKAVERAFSTLQLFKRFCDSTHVNSIFATATAAVAAATGATLEGAYLGVVGVLNDMPLTNGYVLDIGGGSAQTSEIRTGQFHRGQSFTLGALALTESFVNSDPIKTTEFKTVQEEIDCQLDTAFWTKKSTPPH